MSAIEEIGVYLSSMGTGIGIWFEIMIFAGTFVIALILKKHSESEKLRRALKKKGFSEDPIQDVRFQRPKVEPEDPPKARQGPESGSRSKPRSMDPKDPVRLFDDVCSARNPTTSLEVYEEMKSKGTLKTIIDLQKSSKHNVQDFFNGLVQCAIRLSKSELVDVLVHDMRNIDAPRTRVFYESVMKMLAGKRLYHEALQVYAQMQTDGIEPSPVTYSCLVNFAVEVGELDLAINFFEKLSAIQTPSIRAYMTILRAFSKRQDSSNSIRVLNDMQKRNLEPDSLVVNIVLATCVNAGELDQAEALLEQMLSKEKPVVDVVSYNTVIKGHAQKGDMSKALACLEKMSSKGLQPNIITFNTAMDAAVRCKKPGDAWRLLKSMRAADLIPDKYTCSILVKGLHDDATKERVQECLSLLLGLVKDAAKGDVAHLCEVLFLSLLDASLKSKDMELSLDVYKELKIAGVTMSAQAFNGLTRALATEGELGHCLAVWGEMINAGVGPHMTTFEALVQAIKDNDQNGQPTSLFECIQKSGNPKAFATLVRALCKGRRADLAIGVYKSMKEQDSFCKDHHLDLATYASLIGAQCDAGAMKGAVALLEDIKAAGLKPDEAVLNTLLSACFKDGNVNLGMKLFADLTEAGVRPNQTTFSTMVKLYGRSQRLEDALNLVHTMQTQYGLAPSPYTYSCVVQACIRNKQTGKALEIFQSMKDQKMQILDVTLFTTLINGCAMSYSIAQGAQLVEEAFENGLDISTETVQNLITAALRKRTGPDMGGKLKNLINRYNVPINDATRSRLFA